MRAICLRTYVTWSSQKVAESGFGLKTIKVEHRQASSGNCKGQQRWVRETEVLPRRSGSLKPGRGSGTVPLHLSPVQHSDSLILGQDSDEKSTLTTSEQERIRTWNSWHLDYHPGKIKALCWNCEASCFTHLNLSVKQLQPICPQGGSENVWHHSWKVEGSIVLHIPFCAHVETLWGPPLLQKNLLPLLPLLSLTFQTYLLRVSSIFKDLLKSDPIIWVHWEAPICKSSVPWIDINSLLVRIILIIILNYNF